MFGTFIRHIPQMLEVLNRYNQVSVRSPGCVTQLSDNVGCGFLIVNIRSVCYPSALGVNLVWIKGRRMTTFLCAWVSCNMEFVLAVVGQIMSNLA